MFLLRGEDSNRRGYLSNDRERLHRIVRSSSSIARSVLFPVGPTCSAPVLQVAALLSSQDKGTEDIADIPIGMGMSVRSSDMSADMHVLEITQGLQLLIELRILRTKWHVRGRGQNHFANVLTKTTIVSPTKFAQTNEKNSVPH